MGCGVWFFFVFCVMRVMSFAMGEGVSQVVFCGCVVCSVVSGFAGDAGDVVCDFDS